MIVYRATNREFRDHCFKHDIEEIVLASFREATGQGVPAPQLAAWSTSLMQMAKVLNDDTIPNDAGVAIEYTLPQSSKRIDFIVSGYDEQAQPSLIIVELKQWSESWATEKDGIIVARRGGRSGPTEGPHPSYQAWSYAQLLKGFNEAVYTTDMALQPCAYLHNHPTSGGVAADCYAPHIRLAPLFLKGEAERRKLSHFIARHIRTGDASKVIELLENGRIRPSKALADAMAGMLKGNEEFVLIDQQKVVREAILAAVHAAQSGRKQVLIIEGGPGTGKSVIAINVLVELTRRGLLTKYVSKNAAPRRVYAQLLAGHLRARQIQDFFTGSGSFLDTPADTFPALIVDEAIRLNEKSGLYGNLGDHQIRELIRSARCSVFFVDERQRVTFKDIGTVDVITTKAAEVGAQVQRLQLDSQFRCNGSDGYVAWLDDVLGVHPTANPFLDPQDYEFRVMDDATALHEWIHSRNAIRGKARVVAGYCWPWVSKTDSRKFDIVLDGGVYQRRWNLDIDGSLWIIAPSSIDEVGCIHTCQGLELDHVGVILGPDLIVRDGKVVTQPMARAPADRRKSFPGLKGWLKQDRAAALAAADEIIKNTYRTLMSRGMKGCAIYSEDEETRRYFASRIRQSR